jgi:6-phosphogluconolactonase (cycloisomerase 2 family)
MARPAKYGLTDEDKAIAKANGISSSTVLYRLRKGWDKQKAITEIPQKQPLHVQRDDRGNFIKSYSYELGKIRSFKLPEELDPKFEQIVEASGKSVDQYVRDIMVAHVNRKKL